MVPRGVERVRRDVDAGHVAMADRDAGGIDLSPDAEP